MDEAVKEENARQIGHLNPMDELTENLRKWRQLISDSSAGYGSVKKKLYNIQYIYYKSDSCLNLVQECINPSLALWISR